MVLARLGIRRRQMNTGSSSRSFTKDQLPFFWRFETVFKAPVLGCPLSYPRVAKSSKCGPAELEPWYLYAWTKSV